MTRWSHSGYGLDTVTRSRLEKLIVVNVNDESDIKMDEFGDGEGIRRRKERKIFM